jgi:hypothetical protein
MTRRHAGHAISDVYKNYRSAYKTVKLIINDRLGYASLQLGGDSAFFVQGDEAYDFLNDIEKMAGKFNVSRAAAAVYYLNSAGEI